MKTKSLFMTMGLLLVLISYSSAQVPQMINYQGKLTTPSGAPVNDTVQMVFSIYSDEGGANLLWTETQTAVIIEKGVFNVLLGSVNPISYSVFDGSARYLGVKVGGDPEITPRKLMVSVAYTYKSFKADTADFALGFSGTVENADKVDGLHASSTPIAGYLYPLDVSAKIPNDRLYTGSENGLDADLLDGQHASAFLTTANDYGRSGVATDLYEGTSTLTNKYVNEGQSASGDLTGTYPNPTIATNAVTTDKIQDGTIVRGDVATDFKSPYSDTADYARAGAADRDWAFRLTEGNDTTLMTGGAWGIARYGNVLWGNADSTHVNLGVTCTTGSNVWPWKYCTVGGGYSNAASKQLATVGGGQFNIASGSAATIGGGVSNVASGSYGATVAGGWSNTASADRATVSGGLSNTASGDKAMVGGGESNIASANYATVGGGIYDTASAGYATIGGGGYNTASGGRSTIAGGYYNTASGTRATVGGGYWNTASGSDVTVGGGYHNTASADSATIGGGYGNSASGICATIGGGTSNTSSGQYAMVGGGHGNTAWSWAIIGGGYSNDASGQYSTVAGGYDNTASANRATVAGGGPNTASGQYSSVGGGSSNTASGQYATVGGGHGNLALWDYSTVGGGDNNTAGGLDISYATVAGGRLNTANASYATIPGGYADTVSGDFSFATGEKVRLTSDADYTLAFGYDFTSSTDSAVIFFVSGNEMRVGIQVTNPDHILTIKRDSGTDPIADDWTTYPPPPENTRNLQELTSKDNQEALKKLISAPLVKFYNTGCSNHEKIGIAVEEMPTEVLADGDQKAISLNGYITLLHAALKAQQEQIETLRIEIEKIKSSSR